MLGMWSAWEFNPGIYDSGLVCWECGVDGSLILEYRKRCLIFYIHLYSGNFLLVLMDCPAEVDLIVRFLS